MKIYLGTDHAGFELKESVKRYLLSHNFTVEDVGALTYKEHDDYPDIIAQAAEKVAREQSLGVVFGKSGAGECIVANKIKGIRAVLGFSRENVRLARQHNDANILSLGAEFIDEKTACDLVQTFLDTPFSNEERHKRRIEKIKKIEENKIIN